MVAIVMTDDGPIRDALDGVRTHPAADVWPNVTGDALAALTEDIRVNGQREPVAYTPDGWLLDGRARLRACAALGITPRTMQVTDEPWRYSAVTNYAARPGMILAQRAWVASRFPRIHAGERQRLNADTAPPKGRELAQIMKLGGSSAIWRVTTIAKEGTPSVLRRVLDGELAVSSGVRISRHLDEATQTKLLAELDAGADINFLLRRYRVPHEPGTKPLAGESGPPAEDNFSRYRHEHVGVPTLRVLRDALGGLDLVVRAADGLDPAITPAQADAWAKEITKVNGALVKVRRMLNERKETRK